LKDSLIDLGVLMVMTRSD